VGFIVLETEKVANIASQVPVILGSLFLAPIIALINCRNGRMKLSFGNMTVELNVFNLERQPIGFDNMEFSTLNWVGDSVIHDEFDDMFAIEYKSFLINYEPKCYVFEFDDFCSTPDCLIASTFAFKSSSESDSAPSSLELKPLADSL